MPGFFFLKKNRAPHFSAENCGGLSGDVLQKKQALRA